MSVCVSGGKWMKCTGITEQVGNDIYFNSLFDVVNSSFGLLWIDCHAMVFMVLVCGSAPQYQKNWG